MTKQEQIKFIEDTYPEYTNHFSKRAIRHDFFSEIKTELQAYLLGFYAADGSIDEKRKTLRIHLCAIDSDIVDMYKMYISKSARTFTLQKHTTIGRNGIKVQAHESYGVDITSSKLCESLVNLGFGYNKTYAEHTLPRMDSKLFRHFIRGYFDGDGSITGSYRKRQENRKERMTMNFTIEFKKAQLALEFQKEFAKNGIKSNVIYLKRDDMYRLATASIPNIKNLFHFLYDDSNFYGNRKYKKFSYYVNTEVSQLIADHCNA